MSPLDVVILAKRPSPSAESAEACFWLGFPDVDPLEAFCPVQAGNNNRMEKPAKIDRVIYIFFSKLRIGNIIILEKKRQFDLIGTYQQRTTLTNTNNDEISNCGS